MIERFFSCRWFSPALILALAISVLAVYSNTFQYPFHFDDLPQIVENPNIKSLDLTKHIFSINRGVAMFTFALNYRFGGLDVFGYHAVNIGIHIVNGILAYLLLLGTLRLMEIEEYKARMVAGFSALMFALHPIQTQSVTYIIQRLESLASLFYLLGLVFFMLSAKGGAAKRLMLYILVALSYVLGFYSKETAFTMPALIFLYDLYFMENRDLRGVLRKWPLYLVLIVLMAFFTMRTVKPLGGFSDLSAKSSGGSAITVPKKAAKQATPPANAMIPAANAPAPTQAAAAGSVAMKPAPKVKTPQVTAGFAMKEITPMQYLYTQFNVLTYYIALLIVPVNQNLDYDFPISWTLFEVPYVRPGTVLNYPIPPAIVSLGIIAGLLFLAVLLFFKYGKERRSMAKLVSFSILWFFIILAPTSSFLPIMDVIFEHRVYLPSLGIFVIMVLLVDFVSRFVCSRPRGCAAPKAK